MDPRRLAHDLAHFEPRIERGEGVLENHLRRKLRRATGVARETRTVGAFEQHHAVAGLIEPYHDAAQRGLAAAGFADEAHDLAR